MESVIIGIDLGGTNLRIGAVTPDNRMLAPRVMKSSIVADAKNPIGKICELITGYIAVSYTHLDVYKRQVEYISCTWLFA